MRFRFAVATLALSTVTLTALACSQGPAAPAGGPPVEVLGRVKYGAIFKRDMPQGRAGPFAYRFEARAGDEVSAWVFSDSNGPEAWFADAELRPVGTKTVGYLYGSQAVAMPKFRPAASGRYHLVFRDARPTASFELQLAADFDCQTDDECRRSVGDRTDEVARCLRDRDGETGRCRHFMP
jgi:hypothetical protein